MPSSSRSISHVLTSRRGAWVSLVAGILVVIGVLGMLGRGSLDDARDTAPPDSESARAAELSQRFPDADAHTLLAVAARDDGAVLADSDLTALGDLTTRFGADAEVVGPFASDDGKAAVIQVTVEAGGGDGADERAVDDMRETIAAHPIDGLRVQVTGGPAFGVDVAGAFAGADLTLLLVTVGIVALLLIVTYRSPVLWLVPLAVVAVADQLAGAVTAALGNAIDLQFDAGIVSVLVFGAGTNYALLLVSRYREELLLDEDHRRALARAWRATTPAILASNVTVVLSLLTLALAAIPGTRGLGIAAAAGLLIALAAVLLLLPPALAVCGRRLFWPLVPRPGSSGTQGRAWRAVADRVVRRPVLPLVGGAALLAIMATGLLGASVGLSQVEKFRVPSESAAGLEVLGQHFPPGQAEPMIVIAEAPAVSAVTDAVAEVPGVVRVTETGQSADGALVKLVVTGEPSPGTPESRALIRDVRAAVHAVPGADGLVGGRGAEDVDARAGNLGDLLLVAPLVLLVAFAVLVVLLRALVAPMLLLLVNALSAVAAIGAGAWLGRMLFGWDALDLQVPLMSFLFLVALGVDYTIFLVHRARVEAETVGTRAGMVRALAATGGVITSAGLVLAGVFAALGLLPLVTLGQIGLTVGVGVLIDTLVVRTLLVPALFGVVGDRMWWPGRVGLRDRAIPSDQGELDDAPAPALEPVG